jgi:hypothetical protein
MGAVGQTLATGGGTSPRVCTDGEEPRGGLVMPLWQARITSPTNHKESPYGLRY